MAHHSSSPFDAKLTKDDIEALFGEKLGATGQFPRGKLTDADEGETRIAIGTHNGAVVVDLGKPTAWIGFTPDQADEIADLLKKHAAGLRG